MLKSAAVLTNPTPARRDAPCSRLRSRIPQTLNVLSRSPRALARRGLVERRFWTSCVSLSRRAALRFHCEP